MLVDDFVSKTIQHRDAEATRNEICRLYKEGKSQSQIAKSMGKSRQTVAYHLHKLGAVTNESKYDGICCICGRKATKGVPVCIDPECLRYWEDSEDCNPTSLADIHIMHLSAPDNVIFPESAVFCKLDPERKKIFACQADHIRHHYYRRHMERGIRVRIKPPVPIFHTGPDLRGRPKGSWAPYLREAQKRRGYLSHGKEIATVRERINMTQEELAHLAHISQVALCMYERGKREPKVSVAIRIAKVLRVKVEDIWRE